MNIKTIVAGILNATTSPLVFADQFYIDIGLNSGGNNNTADGDTTNDALINADHSIVTNAGLDLTSEATLNSSFGNNIVTGFNPVQGLSGPSNNGYGTDW
jgi:hypothetical protein